VAAESINQYLANQELTKRPRVDVHHYNLLDKLLETGLAPTEYDHEQSWGTDGSKAAIHNYEDRAAHEIIPSDKLFLGHFAFTPRIKRDEKQVDAEHVIGDYNERMIGLPEAEAIKEAKRCMSCGMCFECDNCVIFCPQEAVKRTPKKESTLGRYVYTDYTRCIGCHICADVCPTGYIEMGMGD
jgi:glutamate synthase (NADPH) small chain